MIILTLLDQPKKIYKCDWEDCSRTFVREDLWSRHVARHLNPRQESRMKRLRLRYNQMKQDMEADGIKMGELNQLTDDSDDQDTEGMSQDPQQPPHSESLPVLNNTANPAIPLTKMTNPFEPFRPINGPTGIATALYSNERSTTRPEMAPPQQMYPYSYPPEQPPSPPIQTERPIKQQLSQPIEDPPMSQIIIQDRIMPIAGNTPTSSGTALTITTTSVAQTAAMTNQNPDPMLTGSVESNEVVSDLLPLNSSDLISWLFSDELLSNVKDPLLSPSYFHSPVSLQNLLTPPEHQESVSMSEDKRQELLAILPIATSFKYSGLVYLQRYIGKFWTYFHPQYPLLHKPSFTADMCPSGLLWAIILLGASYDQAGEFAASISEPLRLYILQSPDFHPPAKLWVIQTLVLLEVFEKTMSTRKIHERGHIYHGITLQLIRRGSVLMGLELQRQYDPWQRWIESESNNRAALMAFILDVFDATLFGHSMVLSLHEIQLSLPCSESVWSQFPSKKAIPPRSNMPFLEALKRTLNKQPVVTGSFGRRVLLGGLLCISQQMLQRDLQIASIGWKTFKETWRGILGPTYDFWKQDYDTFLEQQKGEPVQEIEEAPDAVKAHHDDEESRSVISTTMSNASTSTSLEVNGCTAPFYHLAYLTLRIPIRSILVYSGFPNVISSPVRSGDRENSVRALKDWAFGNIDGKVYGNHGGKIAYWHAIEFLREMYLTTYDELIIMKEKGIYRGSTNEEDFNNGNIVDIELFGCCCPFLLNPVSNFSRDHDQTADNTHRKSASSPVRRYLRRNYFARDDPIDKRPYAVYICALAVWAFGHCQHGVESNALKNTLVDLGVSVRDVGAETTPNSPSVQKVPHVGGNTSEKVADNILESMNHIESKEDGYDFLYRITSNKPADLSEVQNKQNTVGLLRMVVDSLKDVQGELVREGRRLLINCIERSLGREKVVCEYMFDHQIK
ncbi:hypothetical protein AWJ20_488 [Sugiyamaella lignohabitans]|uniref:C2H2-type domain-containing protein n=1 Tax=Sugiyamaella lignohabitans TaxID=796027 RepID=A0A167CXV5_9ASCO|nr:uncharacterized protein AWJ20_488 [Sugiyamaella lignohabitans]ANB12239.1 hypothetical protein AWJ20_488 [Sugiyamaella lignohabitans]